MSKDQAERIFTSGLVGIGFGVMNLAIWHEYASYAPSAYSHGERGTFNLFGGIALLSWGVIAISSFVLHHLRRRTR